MVSATREQLLPGERLIVVVHPHILVLARPILVNIAACAVLAALSWRLNTYWLMIFCLIPLAYLCWEILERLLREYIVTDRRVIKREGVFTISSFDASLDKINNVFYEQSLVGRILGYGRVGLETASEQGVTTFEMVPRPVEFKNRILQQRETCQPAGPTQKVESMQADIPRLLEELASLRDRNIITAAEFEAKKQSLLDKL